MRTLARSFVFFLLIAGPTSQSQTFTDASDLLPDGGSGSVYGAAIVDADGDGRMDLSGPARLLLQRDEGFEAVPYATDTPLGAIFGDVDADGLPEVALLDAFEPDIYRYHPARETFVSIPGGGIDPGTVLAQGSAFLDYDRDGALDLFIANDSGSPSLLFRGLGNGTFSDESHLLPSITLPVYGVHTVDYDRDGDSDIYIGVCPGGLENLLLRNNGASGFSEEAAVAGLDDDRASWGVVWFDFDGDGWLDVYVANMPDGGGEPGTNGLFHNNGDGTFTDVAAAAGVAGLSSDQSWNVAAADFDNDGWPDLFVANKPPDSRLYRNDGDDTFTDVTASAGLTGLQGVPVASGDVNGDGWVDLLMIQGDGGTARLFYNDGGSNGWLTIRLRGVASNPGGIGARVEVEAGGLDMVREISGGDGMMSQSHGLTAHFGLGTATTADVTVRWPSGQVDMLTGVARNQHLTLVEGVGLNVPPEPFALLGPADGSSFPEGTPVVLSWEAATDADDVLYTVYVSGPSGDRTYETSGTTFTLEGQTLTPRGEYRWAVVAHDGYSARTSLDPFHFTGGPVPNEPGAPAPVPLSLDAWPNPTRGDVAVRFDLAAPETIALEVFDVLARRVRYETLGHRAAGPHAVAVPLGDLGAGAYLVRLTGTESVATVHVTRVP